MNVRIPDTSVMLRGPATLGLSSRARISVAKRSAFTLLEVVLALSLSVLLLGAIFTAMDQSWKMTAIGRVEMERSQLARALMRRIALDLRSIAYVPPPVTDSDSTSSSTSTGSTTGTSTGSTTGSGSSSSQSSSTNSTTSTTTTSSTSDSDEPSPRSIGIRGNMQRIEMHISRARRDLDFAASVDGAKMHSHSSDLRVVTYQLAMPGVSVMPGGAAMQGLIRTEGDRMATQLVEDKGAAPTALSLPQALAPEVATVQFRFFDGAAWFTVWDSEEAGRLPRAVEVIITFAPSQTNLGPALRAHVSESTNTYRSVVLIPISEPLPAEFTP